MTFDPTKPVVCRNGRKAEILATDMSGELPILAKIVDKDGYRTANFYRTDGTYCRDKNGFDLINVPEKVTMWLVGYKGSPIIEMWTYRPTNTSLFDTCYPIEIEVGRKE